MPSTLFSLVVVAIACMSVVAAQSVGSQQQHGFQPQDTAAHAKLKCSGMCYSTGGCLKGELLGKRNNSCICSQCGANHTEYATAYCADRDGKRQCVGNKNLRAQLAKPEDQRDFSKSGCQMAATGVAQWLFEYGDDVICAAKFWIFTFDTKWCRVCPSA
jgi:hypothetical protein